MAYSDYGGYGYRNGDRVEARSDAVLSLEGIWATPGMYPGFADPEMWKNPEEHAPYYHVILGDGPIFVGLYKQSGLYIHRLSEKLDLLSLCVSEAPPVYKSGKYPPYLDVPHGLHELGREMLEFEVDGHRIRAHWLETDNYYLFVRLEQPDGTVWTGFSGYGVGAGLEDCGYGYSTSDCIGLLEELFPGVTLR